MAEGMESESILLIVKGIYKCVLYAPPRTVY